METPYATVTVVLQARQEGVECPDRLAREDAEQLVKEIGEAREGREAVKLPWLNVSGQQVKAVFLTPQKESALERLARETAGSFPD
jgi:hypothetical protein